MPIVFARVELRGDPTLENYKQLHEFLLGKGWYQQLPGNPDKPMPHAMYQGSFNAEPNMETVVTNLKLDIETNVWTKALVLAVKSADWAQSAG